mgnify:CR=1 FL=1
MKIGCYSFIPTFEKMNEDAEKIKKKREERLKALRDGAPMGDLSTVQTFLFFTFQNILSFSIH